MSSSHVQSGSEEAPASAERRDLTPEEREGIRSHVIEFFAEECDLESEEVAGTMSLEDDLGVDSLTYLELMDELRADHGLEFQPRVIARYAKQHQVKTLDDLLEQIYLFREGKVDLAALAEEDDEDE